MAKNKASFERRERERAKKAKANAKRERRLSKDGDDVTEDDDTPASVDEDAVLGELAALHAAFEEGTVSFDDFEAQRADLLAKLQVD